MTERRVERSLTEDFWVDLNNRNVEERNRIQDGLGATILTSTSVFKEEKTVDNKFLLTAGIYGGFHIKKQWTSIIGSPGVVAKRVWKIDHDCTIDNVQFNSDYIGAQNETQLVQINSATATVIFRNCEFVKRDGQPSECVVLVSGAKAHFINCIFRPAMSVAGNPISNPVAGNTYSAMEINKTGQIHLNTTVMSTL